MIVNKEVRVLHEIKRVDEETRKARLEFLKQCQDIQTITRVMYQHEANRRIKKRGEEDRFVRNFADVGRHKMETIRGLEIEKELMVIEVPEVKEDEVLVHGRITNENLRGVEGVVVSLEDAEGKPVHKFSDKTSESGYYSFVIEPATLRNVPTEVFFKVSTSKGTVLYSNPEPLKLKKGARVLVEMPLDSEVIVARGKTNQKADRGKQKEEKVVKDDLTIISGIGQSFSEKLKKAGITDIKKFAETDDVKLKEVLRNTNIKNIKEMKTNARNILKKQ